MIMTMMVMIILLISDEPYGFLAVRHTTNQKSYLVLKYLIRNLKSHSLLRVLMDFCYHPDHHQNHDNILVNLASF